MNGFFESEARRETLCFEEQIMSFGTNMRKHFRAKEGS